MTTKNRALTLAVVPGMYTVARLQAVDAIPAWATHGGLFSVTRTADELSIVCEADYVPSEVEQESGWRALVVEGRLDFALTGILLSLAAPLADAGVSIFALSTFNTDYLLVGANDLPRAVAALRAAGHRVAE
jgi:hypothetical protein